MHRPTSRLVLAGLAVLALGGCSATSPEDPRVAAEEGTTTAEFCNALTDFRGDLADADPTDLTAYAQRLRDAATRLVAVGLPDDVPAAARAGYDARTGAITDLPATPTPEQLAALDQAQPDLDAYVAATCP